MRAARRSASLAVSLLLLAFPAVAPAQTPGDDQYTDPFGGGQDQDGGSEPDQGGGSQPDQGSEEPEEPAPSGPDTSTSSQEPAAPAPTAQPAAAPGAEQLPRTGADAGLLAVGGTLLLAGGVALRVRVSERSPRRR